MSTTKAVMPLCFTAVGSVNNDEAPLRDMGEGGPYLLAVQDPFLPSCTAVIDKPATSEPAPGSENNRHHISFAEKRPQVTALISLPLNDGRAAHAVTHWVHEKRICCPAAKRRY